MMTFGGKRKYHKEFQLASQVLTKAENLETEVGTLKVLARLLAIQVVRECSTRKEQVELLRLAGLPYSEIQNILGISRDEVGLLDQKSWRP